MRILLVEDDLKIAGFIIKGMKEAVSETDLKVILKRENCSL